jgi:hypothetical protein
VQVSIKGGLGTFTSSLRQARHSTLTHIILRAAEKVRSTLVQEAEERLHEVVGMILRASAQATSGLLNLAAFCVVCQNMPYLLSASLEWFGPTAHSLCTLIIPKTFPHGGTEIIHACFDGTSQRAFRVLIANNIEIL